MPDALQAPWARLLAQPDLMHYLVAGWVAYVLGLGLWIVLQKREPVATLSWLISLAALPYLGFLIYFFFGPQRIRRQRVRWGRTRAGLPDAPTGHAPHPDARELGRLARATTGQWPMSATCVELLVGGAAKYESLLPAIAQAREHVHVEYYIVKPNGAGYALRDALVERARAGVKVRLLLDAVGCNRITRAFLAPLLQAGGEVAWFHPLRLHRIWRRPWLNLRTHRKIVVIDGVIAYTGGINISDEQDERVRSDAYRDLHLRVEGEIVNALQLVFIEDWAYATHSAPMQLPAPHCQPGPLAAQVLISGPDSPWEAIHRLQVSSIHAARKRVWLATPYFVPGEAAMMALTSAALGGLDVRLLVPKMCDSRVVTYATRSYFDELLQAGVRIFEYGPPMLHTKALLCDDDVAIIGSANFDHRSFRLNFEVSLLFCDRQVAGELAALIEHDCAQSRPVENDRDRALWRSRLPEALARLVSPLL